MALEALFVPKEQVYFIQAEGGGPIKIGKADSPTVRLSELQTGNPQRLRILHTRAGGYAEEHRLHQLFVGDRLVGEWFKESVELYKEIYGPDIFNAFLTMVGKIQEDTT